ncbi:MAG: 1-deoxy-D-xylulose-5-phosphate reductoisomerase [Candidatus Magnetobacterium sp. LHC-1]|nr:1-deoxy-D-xylulose-5-phosphate reductoisomerase [Nitrospirota bacterium]
MKHVSILGSTGSIGKSALSFIGKHRDRFRVVGLTANRSIETLKQQILEFRPEVVAVAQHDAAQTLSRWAARTPDAASVQVLSGEGGCCDVAAYSNAEFVLSAIVGSSGLRPTLAAIRAGKHIGLANKETLVMAGDIVMAEVKRHNVNLFPVDSEHSAIFQCLEGYNVKDVRRLLLTASGGPFFGKTTLELEDVSAEDALKHPSWSMGSKITVDSATLMNKGLEVIEAHHLFGFDHDRIDVLVHPQSIVHSMVEFNDGALLAQLSLPDMRGPIAYALSYPERIPGAINRCRLEEIRSLTFHPPCLETFPCLSYAYSALREGGTMPAAMNAANEEVVALFLAGAICFNQIPAIINEVMSKHKNVRCDDLEAIFEVDRWARSTVADITREARK